MLRRRLATTDTEVSVLGLGTCPIGGDTALWGAVDDNEAVAAINQALENGINLIETDPAYGRGHSETLIGRTLRGRRHEAVVVTKCGLLPGGSGTGPRRCLTKDSITAECEASLRRLQTDFIDVLQCHWPDPDASIRQTMEALVTLLRQGKIRAIGVSDFDCQRIATAMEFGPIHSAQVPFSAIHRRAATELLPFCREQKIAALACSPLGKGLLAGRYTADSPIRGVRSRDPEYMPPRFRSNLKRVAQLAAIAARYGKTAPQLALNWTICQPGVTAAIFGAKRPSQVIENAGATDWAIDPVDLQRIDALLEGP